MIQPNKQDNIEKKLREGAVHWFSEILSQALVQRTSEIVEMIEGMNKCYCGGVVKKRNIVHIRQCRLDRRGYYDALQDLKTQIKEKFREKE